MRQIDLISASARTYNEMAGRLQSAEKKKEK